MMIFNHALNKAYLWSGKQWLLRTAGKLYLRLKRGTGIACRECGQELELEALNDFLEAGCLQCGGVKLKVVK